MRGLALALLGVFGSSACSTSSYVFTTRSPPPQYELARQRQRICDQDETRQDLKTWGEVLTIVGAAAAASGAAWLAERAANDRPVPAGPVVLTVGGAVTFGGGVLLLRHAARQAEELEDARLDYAAALEDHELSWVDHNDCHPSEPTKPNTPDSAPKLGEIR